MCTNRKVTATLQSLLRKLDKQYEKRELLCKLIVNDAIYDKPLTVAYKNKLEMVQYNACIGPFQLQLNAIKCT